MDTINTSKIPYESRLIKTLRARTEIAHYAKRQKDLTPDTDSEHTSTSLTIGSPAGDEAKLRGIPAVGVRGGFGGALKGSRPGDGLY